MLYGGAADTADRIVRELQRYETRCWFRDRLRPAPPSGYRKQLLFAILASGEKLIKARQGAPRSVAVMQNRVLNDTAPE